MMENPKRRPIAPVHVVLIVAGLLGGSRISWADKVSNNATVEKFIADLGSPDAQVRTLADTSLYMLPPENFEELEAAANRDDLSPEASIRLKKAVNRIKPWVVARRRIATVAQDDMDFGRRSCLAAYDAVGTKDPKWDEAAREGISRYFSLNNARLAVRQSCEKAMASGCDDPLIQYIEVQVLRQTPSQANRPDMETIYRKSAEAMAASQYPPERKAFAMLRYFHYKQDLESSRTTPPTDEQRAEFDKVADQMLVGSEKLWPLICSQPGIPARILHSLGDDLIRRVDARKGDLGELTKTLEGPLLKALPKDPTPLLLKGKAYISWAWQARGNGYANTVTPEGWKLMGDRLGVAGNALSAAWDLDHNCFEAATQMMTIVLGGDGDRQALELWFSRVMAADPDYRMACSSKLYFLEPKWHGNADEMLAFGRECRDGRNWYAGIPFILVDAHESLSKYGNADDYFKNEQVWLDLQSVYEPYLSVRPGDRSTRSRYTYYACRCGKWSEADRQFKLLGKKAVSVQFGDGSAMERYRQLAETNANTPAP